MGTIAYILMKFIIGFDLGSFFPDLALIAIIISFDTIALVLFLIYLKMLKKKS